MEDRERTRRWRESKRIIKMKRRWKRKKKKKKKNQRSQKKWGAEAEAAAATEYETKMKWRKEKEDPEATENEWNDNLKTVQREEKEFGVARGRKSPLMTSSVTTSGRTEMGTGENNIVANNPWLTVELGGPKCRYLTD